MVRPRRAEPAMPAYALNPAAVERARSLIDARQYVLESAWGEAQPSADDENAYVDEHGWEAFGGWHLGLVDGATPETKSRHGFVFGDFRRVHRSGLIAAEARAAEFDHEEIARAARELLERLDRTRA